MTEEPQQQQQDENRISRIRYCDNGDGSTRRQGHLVSLMGTFWEGEMYPGEVYIEAGNYLAWKHIEERSGEVLPHLPELLEGCDFHWTLTLRETEYQVIPAIKGFVDSVSMPLSDNCSDPQQQPFALNGAAYSYVTLPLSIISSSYEIPLVAGSAVSGALSGQPMFARSIPTVAGDAQAAMLYYASQNITHVACIFIQDVWGRFYNKDLIIEAKKAGVTLVSIPYHDTPEGIEDAIIRLKNTQFRFIYAILFDYYHVLQVAYDYGIVGNANYSWIVPDQTETIQPEYNLKRVNDSKGDTFKLSQAMHGVGHIAISLPQHPPLLQSLRNMAANETLRQGNIDAHLNPSMLDGMPWPQPEFDYYQSFQYDATLAIGLAACQTPGLFTGPELYQTLKGLTFNGTTGPVSFDPKTGDRDVNSFEFRLDNIYISEERSDEDIIRFETHLVATVFGGKIHLHDPFIYYDNTTTPPDMLPPVQYHNYHLVPTWAHVIALLMAGGVMLMSVGWIVWTVYWRKQTVIQASQPIFLCQLCVGTLLMASAVIPLSLQGTEESTRLDRACMAVPWLVILGFSCSLSALFSKAWRLNQLLRAGRQMRRIQVGVVDVMWPFVLLMTINIALLVGWTLVAPWTYQREEVPNSVDAFGRSEESYGYCRSDHRKKAHIFFIPLIIVNFVGMITATIQSYKGRNLPIEFSESTYLAISMASWLESLLLGGPILLVTYDNPTAFYLVASVLLSISSLTILLPVFLPKYWKRGKNRNLITSLRRAQADMSDDNLSAVTGGGSYVGSSRSPFGLEPGGVGGQKSDDDEVAAAVALLEEEALKNTWGKMRIWRRPPSSAADASGAFSERSSRRATVEGANAGGSGSLVLPQNAARPRSSRAQNSRSTTHHSGITVPMRIGGRASGPYRSRSELRSHATTSSSLPTVSSTQPSLISREFSIDEMHEFEHQTGYLEEDEEQEEQVVVVVMEDIEEEGDHEEPELLKQQHSQDEDAVLEKEEMKEDELQHQGQHQLEEKQEECSEREDKQEEPKEKQNDGEKLEKIEENTTNEEEQRREYEEEKQEDNSEQKLLAPHAKEEKPEETGAKGKDQDESEEKEEERGRDEEVEKEDQVVEKTVTKAVGDNSQRDPVKLEGG